MKDITTILKSRILTQHENDVYVRIKFNTYRTMFNHECMPETRSNSLMVTVMTTFTHYLDEI